VGLPAMIPNLEAIRSGLAALATLPNEIPPEQVPSLVAELARAQAALLTATSRPPVTMPRESERPEPDRMLKVEEAAALTGLSRRWFYRHAKTLPFARRLSRKVLRFSRSGLARWLATRRYE
jgi:predicted DNA-binding transcriptional regulator AlpA